MRVALFISGSARDENDSISALTYAAKRLEISACIIDGTVVLESVAQFCSDASIPAYTRENILGAISAGKIQPPDIGLAYHYHSIIKKDLLSFPKNGIVNFHPAPLPEHKGVSGCTYAILHNYKQWGVTAHYMDEGIDTGSIIRVNSFDIEKYNCSSIILQRINYEHLFDLFKEIVDILASGEIPKGTPQKAEGHYYSRKQLNEDKIINMTDDTKTINHKIRAMWFPPFHGAAITINGEKYTLVNQEILDELGKIYPIVLKEHKELFGDLK